MVPKKNLTITELYDLQPVVKLCFILKFSAAKEKEGTNIDKESLE